MAAFTAEAVSSSPAGKIHRRHQPLFKKSASKCVLVKRFLKRAQGHNWNQNDHMRAMRLIKEQRCAIRSEARETLTEVVKALFFHMDFSTNSEYALECRVSVETIAKEIGQHHTYENGRVAYDAVLHALVMLEDAGLIFIAREFDHSTRRHKAMRVFGSIKLCESFGISLAEMREAMNKLNQHRKQHGLRLSDDEKHIQRYVRDLSKLNVAEIRANITRQKLKWVKQQLSAANSPVSEADKQATLDKINQAEIARKAEQQASVTTLDPEYAKVSSAFRAKFNTMALAKIANSELKADPSLVKDSPEHRKRVTAKLKAQLNQ